MSTRKISIRGTLNKSDQIWIAHVPCMGLSSHAITPKECILMLKKTINTLNAENSLQFEVEINDKGIILLYSNESEKFMEFIKARINLNSNHEKLLAELDQHYVFGEELTK